MAGSSRSTPFAMNDNHRGELLILGKACSTNIDDSCVGCRSPSARTASSISCIEMAVNKKNKVCQTERDKGKRANYLFATVKALVFGEEMFVLERFAANIALVWSLA